MFNEATEALSKSALKVMNMIFVMSRECGGFSCDTLRSLFTALVQPVLEYGSEIWGLREFLIMERTVLKYCKKMLHGAAFHGNKQCSVWRDWTTPTLD